MQRRGASPGASPPLPAACVSHALIRPFGTNAGNDREGDALFQHGLLTQVIGGEELARANAPASLNGLGIGIVAPTLIHHGTEFQKRDHVSKILTAEEIWCQLYSEPNSGSDLASLQCRADVDGDEFIIN